MGHLRLVSVVINVASILGLAACASRPPSPPEGESVWKPFELGSYHRPVTTDSPEAQQAFDQGLIWAFAFNHDEAVRAFDEARRLDPKMAIAAWGIALVHGPHINNPMVDEAHQKAAWAAVEMGMAKGNHETKFEHKLMLATAKRFSKEVMKDRAPLDKAYAEAMREVYKAPIDPAAEPAILAYLEATSAELKPPKVAPTR